MNLHSDDCGSWFDNLSDVEPEYVPIKCWSVLQFYGLKGRTTIITKENLFPIEELHYVVQSKSDHRLYFREFRNYNVDTLYFYRRTLDFSGEDTAVETLRRYVDDGTVWILMTKEQVADITTILERLYYANFHSKGKLAYKIYVRLLKESLDYEDYQDYGRSLTGYKTTCRQFDNRILELWRGAIDKK